MLNKLITIVTSMLFVSTTLLPADNPIMARNPKTTSGDWQIRLRETYQRQGFNIYGAEISFQANDSASRLRAGSLQIAIGSNEPITAHHENQQGSDICKMPIWQLVCYADKYGQPLLPHVKEANWSNNFFTPWACALLASGICVYTKIDPKKIAYCMAAGGFAFALYNTVRNVRAENHAARIDQRTTELIQAYKYIEREHITQFWNQSTSKLRTESATTNAALLYIDSADYIPYVHTNHAYTATTKQGQMQYSRELFHQRATNDILNPCKQEREARIWSGLSLGAAGLAVAAWRSIRN